MREFKSFPPKDGSVRSPVADKTFKLFQPARTTE